MSWTPELLLQRQLEVSASFRHPIQTPQDLKKARTIIYALNLFMPAVEDLSVKLSIPLECIFQCFLQIGIGDSLSFDQQARKGAVPMHQAKVLDRNAQLAAQQVEPTLRTELTQQQLDNMVHSSHELRDILRMKVEDNNDFKMAHQMVQLAHDYLTEVYRLANGFDEEAFKLYTAQTEEDVKVCGTFNPEPIASNDNSPSFLKPLPENFIAGLESEILLLKTGKESVAQRQASLSVIREWLQHAEQSVLDSSFGELLPILDAPIRIHLAEKRSALLRLSTSLVTIVAVRSPPHLLFDGLSQSQKICEILSSWLKVLFKSVFVTVSAVANATDEAVRDIVVSSGGASFVVSTLLDVLQTATQSELRKKLLGYLSLALLSSNNKATTTVDALAIVLSNQLLCGDSGVRKAARTVLIVVTDVCGNSSLTSQCVAAEDSSVRKAVSAEKDFVLAAAREGVEAFEKQWLAYDRSCTASLYLTERVASFYGSQSFVVSVKDKDGVAVESVGTSQNGDSPKLPRKVVSEKMCSPSIGGCLPLPLNKSTGRVPLNSPNKIDQST